MALHHISSSSSSMLLQWKSWSTPLQPCASLHPATAGGGGRSSFPSVSFLSVLTARKLESKRRGSGRIHITRLSLETMVVEDKVVLLEMHTQCPDIVKERNSSEQREVLSRRSLFLFMVSSSLFATSTPVKAKSKSPYDDKRLLEQNRRIQEANNVPQDFPNFIREGFEVKVVTSDSYVKCDSGLIYLDIAAGKGDSPKDGQQVTFHYIGYNESGRRIDSTYLQGTPAKIRMGTNALVPGFEEGIRDMKPGGKRRIVIPPELGPPVGPSTFFSSKQFEVFDVELLSVQNCERRTILAFYSDVVCS